MACFYSAIMAWNPTAVDKRSRMTQTIAYDFQNKSVLVIGGTSGIGWATAEAFAKAGAKVAVAGLLDGSCLETELLDLGAQDALVMAMDVRFEQQVAAGCDQVAARFGGIDIGLNFAGTEGPFGGIETMDEADFDRVISINLRGVWLGMKHLIRHLLVRGGGVIINMSSSAGIKAIPNVTVYSASKHGIIGLTKGGALEHAAAGIRINAIAPGPVETGLLSRMVDGHISVSDIAAGVPMKRISQPEEIANVALWLASDGASFVTGETIVVDGGMTQL